MHGPAQTALLDNVSVVGLYSQHRCSLTMDRCYHRPPALLNGCEGILQLSDVPAESLALPPRAGSAACVCKHGRNVGQINASTKVSALAAHNHLHPGNLAAGQVENTSDVLQQPHCLHICGSIQGLECLQYKIQGPSAQQAVQRSRLASGQT